MSTNRRKVTKAITKRRQGAKGGSSAVSPTKETKTSRVKTTFGKGGSSVGQGSGSRSGGKKSGRGTVISKESKAKTTKKDLKRVTAATDKDIKAQRAVKAAKKVKTAAKIAKGLKGGLIGTAASIIGASAKEAKRLLSRKKTTKKAERAKTAAKRKSK